MLKKLFLASAIAICAFSSIAQQTDTEDPKVYFTQEITPEALVNIY